MSKPLPLPVWDRRAGRLFKEFMDDRQATYESRPLRSFKQWLEAQPAYDWLIATYQNTRRSARQIEPFIRKYQIDMSEFEDVPYRSFAEFFDRRFRDGVRSFPERPGEMGAFAEARYFGWEELDARQAFPIKGRSLDAAKILGSNERAKPFIGGPVLLARLSPVDYHHVHYLDDGRTTEDHRLGRRLWTVNWHALQNKPNILFVNERVVNVLETQNFGLVAFTEIGALSVGRIVQSHPLNSPFRRGDRKSAFRFGGTAIIVFGQAGRWQPRRISFSKPSMGWSAWRALANQLRTRDAEVC
jgi:phosphatidylserine decarboxylase